MSTATADWFTRLQAEAPDVVACWRAFDWSLSGLRSLRRELRVRVGPGSVSGILAQQEAVANELERVLRALPEPLLRAPGGEEDWNVAQAFAHTTAARRFLATWASWDAAGIWPDDRPPTVTPSIPGPPNASVDDLLALLEKSRLALRNAAARIEGSELNRCRMDHPLVGHLRCGDWLLFVGIHDLMHLEQLHDLRRAHHDGADA